MLPWTALPIYRVSPQLLVTKEHIISESSSTPSGFSSSSSVTVTCECRFSPFRTEGSGDARVLRGVDVEFGSCPGELCDGEVGPEVGACEALRAC